MINLELFSHLLFPDSTLHPTRTEATGSGWSVTYDCFLYSTKLRTIVSNGVTVSNGFFFHLHLSNVLKPLYIPHCSFFLGTSYQSLHFPPSHFSSYSSVLIFVLSTLAHFGVPASDPDSLARPIFSFAHRHHRLATTSPVPLYISFNCTTVLRNHDEAADWIHGGSPESPVVRSLRTTFESLRELKDESLDEVCLMKSLREEEVNEEEESCMVCLEGFEEEMTTKHSVSRLPCSHMFHFRCISEWLSVNHRCPICRYPMPWVHAIFPDAICPDDSSSLLPPESEFHR